MKEREQPDRPYWHLDLAIGEGRYCGEVVPIHLRLHVAQESYWGRQEMVPLAQPRGRRVYVHARPYVLQPEISVLVRLFDRPGPDGAIGKVVSSKVKGMQAQEIGNAQAWCYPEERLLVLWECYLFDRSPAVPPAQDQTLTMLWRMFERLLQEHVGGFDRIVTPGWEPEYAEADWRGFLEQQGYQPTDKRAFAKRMGER